MNNNRKNKAGLRFNAKYLFLTYPKCELPLAIILDQLRNKCNTDRTFLKKYIISHELHNDGLPHRHCWLELNSNMGTVPQDYFDLVGDGKTYHGNYDTCRFKDNAAKYTIKDGDYITDMADEEIKGMVSRAYNRKLDKQAVCLKLIQGESLLNMVQKIPYCYGISEN